MGRQKNVFLDTFSPEVVHTISTRFRFFTDNEEEEKKKKTGFHSALVKHYFMSGYHKAQVKYVDACGRNVAGGNAEHFCKRW